jgi:hypothetical protein
LLFICIVRIKVFKETLQTLPVPGLLTNVHCESLDIALNTTVTFTHRVLGCRCRSAREDLHKDWWLGGREKRV